MRVSVITINYNNGTGLEKTIRSVIKQSYIDYEYIVIDGGSTDSSKQILEIYSDKITCWVSEPDKGIYEAMNKGIIRAKGEFCHFLNSGDIYADDEVLRKIFENKEYSVPLLRGVQICAADTGIFRWRNHGNRDVTLFDLYVDTMQHQATFIRRSLFDKYGLYDIKYKIVSDWKFFMQTMLGDEKSVFLDMDIVIFDMTGISNDPKYYGLMCEERNKVIDELIPKTIRATFDHVIELEKEKRKYRRYIRLGKFINKLKGKKP
ncbi:glycosyltransferase family 2 protein [Dysgonomonas termitidis]|uniref:Glycosyltransferase family 2 protein n=1 Tax=Dysgonomonas termitidis TaxID=1516126 RepID=A0ABV9L1A3_9BACT